MSRLTHRIRRGSGKLYRVSPGAAILVHLCDAESWAAAQRRGEVIPDPAVGFVHLSTPEQVYLPANRLYRDRPSLLLLYVDPAQLRAPLHWEPGAETDPPGMVFPHLYGPLPVAAVTAAVSYLTGPDGFFPRIVE